MPQDGILYKAKNACDHNWIVPFLEGNTNGVNPNSLVKQGCELTIMQCHTHPLDPSGKLHSNNWAVGDLTSLRVLQEYGLPVTHALLYTPERGIKILESDFKNKQTIKNVEAQINVSIRPGFVDIVTSKKDVNGNAIMQEIDEGNGKKTYLPVPEFHFDDGKSFEK